MDALSSFLDGPRARAAFMVRVVMESPWSISVEDRAPIAVLPMLSGEAWLDPLDGSDPMHFVAGDLVIVRGPDDYVMSGRPGEAPNVAIIDPGVCRPLDDTVIVERMDLGVRTWGNCADGPDQFLVGNYRTDGEVSRWLLDSLPRFVVLRHDEWASPLLPLLADEMRRDQTGQQVVLDRLLDLLFVSALREVFAGADANAPAWFGANADPVVGKVVRMMQDEPEQPWTVANLASAVGVSRALLARRFHEVTGEPPMTFLTRWRMALAADLMLERDATVTSVAAAVGYSSPFTFSTAFKRAHGLSPRDYRIARTAAADVPDDAVTLDA
ncbi:AraC family transcriptional regulator [Desertimonas flava]|uniref:AraC family transcriptional regulator n=3 Tax=Desertimonas flava TaxID=2064846 RepID=UPI000E341B87|nr:AraC family transcriptional regulator [Desertimonas flava]